MPATEAPTADPQDVRPAPELGEGDSQRDVIARVADAKVPNDIPLEDVADATDWFLSSDPTDDEPATETVEINVGTPGSPRWIRWGIQAVAEDELNRINRMVANRQQRRGRAAANDGGEQQAITNARIVAAGTIDPDVAALAQQMGVADPAMAIRRRFQKKPGLLLQLSGQILTLSGYDDDDLREGREVKAAGN